MSYNNILDNPIFHTWKRADYGTDVGRVTERTIPDPAALNLITWTVYATVALSFGNEITWLPPSVESANYSNGL